MTSFLFALRTPFAIAIFTGILLPTLLAGCPGRLEHPEWFRPDASTFECFDVTTELFPQRCAGSICHEGNNPAAGLNLITPDVETRLVGVPSKMCGGILVDPADPEASVLFQKLNPATGCGSPMPLGGAALTEEEMSCVRNWILGLDAIPPPVDAGNDSDGAGGGGGAGGAGGSGNGGGDAG